MINIDGVYYFETIIDGAVTVKHRFDFNKYMEYYKLKTKDEYPDREIKDHPLLGQWFIHDGKLCVIEKVSLHWYFGYYEHVVYRMHGTKSHGTIIIKNKSSVYETVIESYFDFINCKKVDKEDVPEENIE